MPRPPPRQTLRADFPHTAFAETVRSEAYSGKVRRRSWAFKTKVVDVSIERFACRWSVGTLTSPLKMRC